MLAASLLSQERLDVPRFEQEKRLWCGPAALQSVLAFNKCLVSQKDIFNFINSEEGCFIQELGLFALSKNFNVKIHSYDMIYVDPTWSSLNEREISYRIAQRSTFKPSKSSKTFYKSLMGFLDNGGNISIKLPSKDEIISILDLGTPIIAIVNSNSLYDRSRLDSEGKPNDISGSAGGHFIVLTGYKNGYFSVIDPSYENPISFVQEDRFMFSFSLWGGWMMIINEKN